MQPGTYQAKVTASDPSGATATRTLQIVVTDPAGNVPPNVEAAALPRSGAAPLEVQLSAAGTDPDGDALTYTWDFGDGSPSADRRAATHTYARAGSYTATVTVVDGHGRQRRRPRSHRGRRDRANQAPTVEAAADPRSGSAPLTVHFTSAARDADGDGLLSVWSFGDGGQAGGPDALHTYTQPGTYDATVKVTDPSGASATATVQVVVTATAPAAAAPKPGGRAGAGGVVRRRRDRADDGRGLRGARPGGPRDLHAAMSGTATLKVSARTARSLRLKSTTLRARAVRCAGAGTRTVTLKPSKAAGRALRPAGARSRPRSTCASAGRADEDADASLRGRGGRAGLVSPSARDFSRHSVCRRMSSASVPISAVEPHLDVLLHRQPAKNGFLPTGLRRDRDDLAVTKRHRRRTRTRLQRLRS